MRIEAISGIDYSNFIPKMQLAFMTNCVNAKLTNTVAPCVARTVILGFSYFCDHSTTTTVPVLVQYSRLWWLLSHEDQLLRWA